MNNHSNLKHPSILLCFFSWCKHSCVTNPIHINFYRSGFRRCRSFRRNSCGLFWIDWV